MKYLTSFINTFLFGFILSQIYFGLLILLYSDLLYEMMLLTILQLILSALVIGMHYVFVFVPIYLINKNRFNSKSTKETYFQLLPLATIPSLLLAGLIIGLNSFSTIDPELWLELINLAATISTSFWIFVKSIHKYPSETSSPIQQSSISITTPL
jgi:cytochrome bd-type quinol oxidase subunit 2